MDLKETECEDVDQDRFQWRALMNVVMNFRCFVKDR